MNMEFISHDSSQVFFSNFKNQFRSLSISRSMRKTWENSKGSFSMNYLDPADMDSMGNAGNKKF